VVVVSALYWVQRKSCDVRITIEHSLEVSTHLEYRFGVFRGKVWARFLGQGARGVSPQRAVRSRPSEYRVPAEVLFA
jgi:hypothetical protein